MYRLLRNLHLASGLVAVLPLALFAFTGLFLAYPIYNPAPATSEPVLTDVPTEALSSPRAMAAWVMRATDARGSLQSVDVEGAAVTLRIARPGRDWQVAYRTDGPARVELLRRRHHPLVWLGYLHQTAGVRDPYWGTRAWGVLALVSSAALVLLALSGLALWFQRRQDRRAGAIVLAAGLVWGVGLLVAIRLG